MGNSVGKQTKTEAAAVVAEPVTANKDENVAPEQSGDVVVVVAKVITENGNGEAAKINGAGEHTDEITVENGGQHKEETTETVIPTAVDAKQKKKRNPMSWFRKNVSFKKERREKKCNEEKKVAPPAEATEAEPVVENKEEVAVAGTEAEPAVVVANGETATTEAAAPTTETTAAEVVVISETEVAKDTTAAVAEKEESPVVAEVVCTEKIEVAETLPESDVAPVAAAPSPSTEAPAVTVNGE